MKAVRPTRLQARTQLLRYLVVGGVAVAVDGAVYASLVGIGAMTPDLAKRVSFAAGAAWAFIANKYFTFASREFALHEPLLFTAVYLAGWFLNAVIHDVALRLTGIKAVAFLLATSTSTCTNFIGQKWIVFRATAHRDQSRS